MIQGNVDFLQVLQPARVKLTKPVQRIDWSSVNLEPPKPNLSRAHVQHRLQRFSLVQLMNQNVGVISLAFLQHSNDASTLSMDHEPASSGNEAGRCLVPSATNQAVDQ
uniref:(northern house mosquito) hypothetical protein n=1 Tax=Culex pipiens TaxID=7175 RepID=A0A8D8HQ96_CULPI